MDSEIERLFVSVGADVTSALRGLGQVDKKLDTLVSKTSKASSVWSGFTGGLAKAGLAIQGVEQIIGVVEGAAKTVVDFLLIGAKVEAGMVRLEKAIENTGFKLDEKLTKKLEANVEAMKLAGGYTTEELVPAYANLVAITGNYQEATDRMSLAMDFARGSGLELATASRLLGKVTDETTSVLARYGIHVEKGASATELLRKVQAKFGGQSAAFMATNLGKWTQLGIKVDNFKEKLSLKLAPAFTKLMDIAEMLFDKITAKFDEWEPSIRSFFAEVSKGAQQMIHWFGAIGEMYEVLTRTGRKDAGGELIAALEGGGDKAGAGHAKDIMTSLANVGKQFTGEQTDKGNPITQFGDSLKQASDALIPFAQGLKKISDFLGIHADTKTAGGSLGYRPGMSKEEEAAYSAEHNKNLNGVGKFFADLGNSGFASFIKETMAKGKASGGGIDGMDQIIAYLNSGARDSHGQLIVNQTVNIAGNADSSTVAAMAGEGLTGMTEALRQQSRRIGNRIQ